MRSVEVGSPVGVVLVAEHDLPGGARGDHVTDRAQDRRNALWRRLGARLEAVTDAVDDLASRLERVKGGGRGGDVEAAAALHRVLV